MALDDASAAYVAQAKARLGQLSEISVAQARRRCAAPRSAAAKRVRERQVAVTGGSITVRTLKPVGRPQGLMVYYHGGGWVLGGLDESEPVAQALARESGCVVISVGYRHAPEYRYPTAVDDAWAALRWVAGDLDDGPGRRLPLIVAGEGAGGNLAAIVARRAAEAGDPPVDLQVLICPVTDSDFDSLSYTDPENQLLLDRDTMIWFWDHYAPDVASRSDPDASPLQAVFLSGLAPAVILTAEHDVLRDEGELYATRLVQAGVEVEHRRFAGQPHGFFSQVDVLPGSQAGLDFVANAITRRLDSLRR